MHVSEQQVILFWLALASAIAFVLFALDKFLAVRGLRRVSEARLLAVALFGGALGAKAAQHLFRHKTRKQPFGLFLNLYLGLNILVVSLLLIPATRAWINGHLNLPF